MRRLAAIAALLPSLALAGPMRPQPHKLSVGASQVALRLPFSAPGCFASGEAMGTKGEVVTTVRASTATYTDAAGIVQTCAANQLRVTPQGALIEPAATNLALWSAAFDNPAWFKGTLTATADQANAPDGALTAELLATTSANGNTSQTVTAAGTAYACSVWLRSVSGTQSVDVRLYDSTASAQRALATLVATTTWRRAVVTSSAIVNGNSLQCIIYPGQVGGSGSVYAWGAQLETGAVATSYIPTVGASANRAADTVSVAWPSSLSLGKLCLVETVNPATWTPGSTTILASTSPWAAANTFGLLTDATPQARFTAYDSGVLSRSVTFSTTGVTGTHRIGGCLDNLGGGGFYFDGALKSSSFSGGGTGILSARQASLALGGGVAATISDLRVCKVGQLQGDCQ